MKKNSPPIKSIAEEKAACIAAFKAAPRPKWVWCCHHEWLLERLVGGWRARIIHIDRFKAATEQAVRFRNFRPVRVKVPDRITDNNDPSNRSKWLIALHNHDWPDNTWRGTTIFRRLLLPRIYRRQ